MNVHSVTLKGKRDQNEDKHEIILNSNNNDKNLNNVNFFAVYDGHGGKQVSEYVHKNMTKYFMNKKVSYPLQKQYVVDIFDGTQIHLKSNDQQIANHCGTTALIVVHFNYNDMDYLNIMNLGDCRCILCRDNLALPLTKDHKPHWPEEVHRIKNLGGKITFDGYDWRIKDLSVSRAFGDIDAVPYVTHRPDLFRYKLDKNDKFIVIACDGLWDVLSNSDVTNYVLLHCYDSTTQNRINKEENIAKKLGEFAIKKGSTDNVTVIVVFL